MSPQFWVGPVTLAGWGVKLKPLKAEHAAGLAAAASDGDLWKLTITSVPAPGDEAAYIATALADPARVAFAVTDAATGLVLGSTSFHDIVPAIKRLEIGYTWYGSSVQRSHVNTACKLLLLTHAFEVLHAAVVGWRTDNENFASQRAIERLGAHHDGELRHHKLRRDGSVRDTVMYSMLADEWPAARQRLTERIGRPRES
ncbi:GNAT family N-acetyltransferase [Micropruina sp.]|uniref:GNAT family N-acetyltransferase n=1 Tax=Micropruina sp. TaxID=2737536 RepID=UPI0039E4F659